MAASTYVGSYVFGISVLKSFFWPFGVASAASVTSRISSASCACSLEQRVTAGVKVAAQAACNWVKRSC